MLSRWSLKEEKYLVDNWGQADVGTIIETLKRTEDSVVRKAQRLGLDTHNVNGEYLKKRWTEEEELVLKELYRVKPIKELLALLPGRTRESIIKRAKSLGLNSANRHWTEEEIMYLEEKWGVISVDNIAKKLGRTKNAILLKAHKIGLREQVIANGEYLTPKDIAMILGVGTKTIYNWMDKDYIKYRRLKINSVKKYQITNDNFKLFLEKHQEKWNARTADMKFIKACFTTCRDKGKDQTPAWLLNKIELDKLKKSILPRKQWTVKEEVTLKAMVDTGKTCKEIALILNRSFFSVQGKISSKIRGQVIGSSTIALNMNGIDRERLRVV